MILTLRERVAFIRDEHIRECLIALLDAGENEYPIDDAVNTIAEWFIDFQQRPIRAAQKAVWNAGESVH